MTSPYRVPAKPDAAAPRVPLDRSLAWAALIIWAGSVLRAIVGAMRHEAPSQELALAFVLAIAIPWLVRRARSAAHAQKGHANESDH